MNVTLQSAREADGRLCFEVTLAGLGAADLDDCIGTGDFGFFEQVASRKLEDPNWAMVYAMDSPYVVTGVSQDGNDVDWVQDGDVLVVVGLPRISGKIETVIRFTIDAYSGQCEFRSRVGSCRLNLDE